MTRFIAAFLTVAAIGAATPVFAQESAPGPGKVVITIIPGGATFFTEAEDNPLGPSFGNYELGGSVAVNFNRYVGVEGEVSGGIGVSQTLQVGSVDASTTARRISSTTAATSSSRRRIVRRWCRTSPVVWAA